MKTARFARGPLWVVIILMAAALGAGRAPAADFVTVELSLIWGTNDPQSPDPNHKPVDADAAKLLDNSPYRWKHYFLVNRRVEEVPVNSTKHKLEMSKQCQLDIK